MTEEIQIKKKTKLKTQATILDPNDIVIASIKVISGKEAQAKRTMEEHLQSLKSKNPNKDLESIKFSVLTRTEKKYDKKGNMIETPFSIYPGYVILECKRFNIAECEVYCIRPTTNARLIKNKNGEPVYIRADEYKKMIEQTEKRASDQISEEYCGKFSIGQKVVITNGAFESCQGLIEVLDSKSNMATISISMFDQLTRIEINISDIKSI